MQNVLRRIASLVETRVGRILLLGISAVLTALVVCFPVLGALEWVSLIPLAFVLFSAVGRETFSFRRSYLAGLGFFMIYYAVIFHWFFYMYPLDFLGLHPAAAAVVVVLACFGIAFLQALVGAFVFPLFLLAARGRLVRKCPILMPFLAAALWCVMEWSLTLTWAGVPWSRLVLGQMEMSAVVQTVSLFGSYFITFLIVVVNFLLIYAFYYHKWVVAALPIALFAVNFVAGAVLLDIGTVEGEPLRVAAVQGNVSSEDKWNDDKFLDGLSRYIELTKNAAEGGAELVLWSESVIPYSVNEMESVDSLLQKLADTLDIHLLVGGFYTESGEDYNAIYAYAPDGSLNATKYFKRHLVPFGEFVPMEGLVRVILPPLAQLNAFSEALEPGTDSNIIRTEVGDIGCLICFDSIYEESVRDSVLDGAELIALSTNDSWFADSAALYMHNGQAALRAIESGRYIVRSANTGISSIITPHGDILDSEGVNDEGVATAKVYLRDGLTLYTRIGNLVIWLSIAGFLAVISYDVTANLLDRKRVRDSSRS